MRIALKITGYTLLWVGVIALFAVTAPIWIWWVLWQGAKA